MSHTIQDFRYLRLILELRVRACSCLPRQIFNFSSNLWICFNETVKEFTSIAKPTADTRKIQNKLTTMGSSEKKLQIKTILFENVAEVKDATSAHS